MNGVILTSYFTKKKHPNQYWDTDVVGRNADGFVGNNDFNYIKKWYESLVRLKLSGVVFHDNLSNHFTNKYANKYIKFQRVEDSQWSNNDYRFYCWRDYLQGKDYDWVFHNDVADVVVIQNPVKLLEDNPEYTFFACRDNCSIASKQFVYLPVAQIAGFDGQFYFTMNPNLPLINMGVVGGRFEDMKRFYEKFCEVRDLAGPVPDFSLGDKMNPFFNMNMWVGNNVLRYHIQEKILLGQPVTSVYKKYENDRKDVYFIHK